MCIWTRTSRWRESDDIADDSSAMRPRSASLPHDAPRANSAGSDDRRENPNWRLAHRKQSARDRDRGPHHRRGDDLGPAGHHRSRPEVLHKRCKEPVVNELLAQPRARSGEAPRRHDQKHRRGHARNDRADRRKPDTTHTRRGKAVTKCPDLLGLGRKCAAGITPVRRPAAGSQAHRRESGADGFPRRVFGNGGNDCARGVIERGHRGGILAGRTRLTTRRSGLPVNR